jgi:putative flippase GtrA
MFGTDLRHLLRRWLAFGSVGVLGFGVQFSALLLMAGGLGINYLLATAIAVELAILHNFLWHERWTWRDRRVGGVREVLVRLVQFNAGTAITSIGGNVALMWLFVSFFGLHYAPANVLAVASLGIVNFLFCDRLVFRTGKRRAWWPAL